jgi:hypothetical protein
MLGEMSIDEFPLFFAGVKLSLQEFQHWSVGIGQAPTGGNQRRDILHQM